MFQSKTSSINISVRLQYWANIEGAVITLFNKEILPCTNILVNCDTMNQGYLGVLIQEK